MVSSDPVPPRAAPPAARPPLARRRPLAAATLLGVLLAAISPTGAREARVSARVVPIEPTLARPVHVADLARPTPRVGAGVEQASRLPDSLEILDARSDDMLAAVEAFAAAGHRVRQVELGNEFHPGPDGGVDGRPSEADGGPIRGSWTNALFTTLLTLRLAALDERIDLLDVHAIAVGGNRPWNMLEDAGTVSGNGLATGAIGRAFRDRRELRELAFSGVDARPAHGDTPGVHGLRLSGGDGESLVIVNATGRAVNDLDVDAALLRGGRYLLEQHHDATPLDAPVRAGRGGGIASRWGDLAGRSIDLPPFSLSVIRSVGR